MANLLPYLNFPISLYRLRCKKCKKEFTAVTYDQTDDWTTLHCNKCGDFVRVDWQAKFSKKILAKASLRNADYNRNLVEGYLKLCACGGQFRYKAEPHCLHCNSGQVEKVIRLKPKFISYDPDSIWKDEVKDL